MSRGGSTASADQSRSAAGGRNPWLIAIVVSIATFMLVLDTSIANVALRHIAGSLAAGIDESTWVLTTYLVANAVIIPVSGWLASVIGRKRYYMLCVALFTVASFLCGIAPNLGMLIFFRILQGVGGGGMAPSEQSILADTFPPEQRAQAFALYGVAVIVAPTVGPALGGWITDNYSWNWIFFINVPIGILSLILVQWLVVEPPALERERRELLAQGIRVDWVGFFLVAAMLGSLELILDRGEREDWLQSNFIVTLVAISALSFAVFLPWEWLRRDPVVDVKLLFQRQFGTSFLMMLALGAILFSSIQLIPQLLQTSYGYTAQLSGLALMPGGFAMLVVMAMVGRIAGHVQPKYMMAFGMAVIALSMWYSTGLEPGADFGFFVRLRIFQMVAFPFLFIPISMAAYAGLPGEKTNQASALINAARNLGGSIGISIATSILAERTQLHQSRLVEHVSPSSPAYQQAYRNMTDYFASHGASLADAQRRAVGLIGQLVQSQAQLLAYIDVFWFYAAFAALMIVLALSLRRVESGTQTGPAGH